MDDSTDLTTLTGEDNKFLELVENKFKSDGGRNLTWGVLRCSTLTQFFDDFGDSGMEKALLRAWVKYYKLEDGFEIAREQFQWKTPTKRALQTLELDDALSPNEAIGALLQLSAAQKLQFRYTKQDESMIGRRIQDDNADRNGGFQVERPSGHFSLDEKTIAKMLLPKARSTSANEDDYVNEPFSEILKATCMSSHSVHFTGKRSNLIDSEGREQRVDLSVHDGSKQEWATLVTVLEGKMRLLKPERDEGLGQCMRRARAILEAQPWRKFVVIALFSLKEIMFLRVIKGDHDVLHPTHTDTMPCFVKSESGTAAGDGFLRLADMMANPAKLGYVPVPIQFDFQTLDLSDALPISARKETCVFVAKQKDGAPVVVKFFFASDRARKEHDALALLSGISTTTRALDEVQELRVTDDGEEKPAFALLLQPYCHALVPSIASPQLFKSYAETLHQAHLKGLCNNDISPSNLLVLFQTDDYHVGIVADWDIATAPGTPLARHSGKLLWAPFIPDADQQRVSSLKGDFESLFYVAVSCAENGARWMKVAKRPDRTVADIYAQRTKDTGLFGRKGNRFPGDWHDYLVGISAAIAEGDEEGVLRAFQAVN